MKLNLFEKMFIGVYSIRFGKTWLSFNKLATLMIPSLTLAGLFQEGSLANIPFLFWLGIVGIVVGIFAFFYLDIFPSRAAKNEEDAKKFFTIINDDTK